MDRYFLLVCRRNFVERFLSNEVSSQSMHFFLNGLFFLGDYVLVEHIDEGDKVKAQIVQILLRDNIKYIRSQNCW